MVISESRLAATPPNWRPSRFSLPPNNHRHYRTMRAIDRDSLPHLWMCLTNALRIQVGTPLAYLLCRWWRVDVGKDCRFDGVPAIRRLPGSTIRIGRECRFNSSELSNFMGLNHRCVLATLSDSAVLEIGGNSGFSGTAIAAMQHVRIGKRVLAGANTLISDTDWHPVDPVQRASGDILGTASPVDIGDDVWLGVNSVVLKGVTIGARTVIAANSVVTCSLPSGVVAAGVPARVVKDLGHVN